MARSYQSLKKQLEMIESAPELEDTPAKPGVPTYKMRQRLAVHRPEISPSAYISAEAAIGDNVVIEPYAYVLAGAVVHSGAIIKAGAVVGVNAQVESGAIIGSGSSIGQHCIVESNAVVGPMRHMSRNPKTGEITIAHVNSAKGTL